MLDEEELDSFEEDSENGNYNHIEAISDHIEKYIGEIEYVLHELVSPLVHIDVHVIKPIPERNFYTFVTSGMSEMAMILEDGSEKYAEVFICLPSDWKIGEEEFEDENNYWPIRLLKSIARFPHEEETWVGYGHTIQFSDPIEPYASNNKFIGSILLPPISFDGEFCLLNYDNHIIEFYLIIPLYEEEMKLKIENGSESLITGFNQIQLNEVVDIKRKNITLDLKQKSKWKFW